MDNPNLEQRVKDLEQKVATLEGQVQEQASVKVKIVNSDELQKLISETIDNINKIKNFKFKIDTKM